MSSVYIYTQIETQKRIQKKISLHVLGYDNGYMLLRIMLIQRKAIVVKIFLGLTMFLLFIFSS